MKITKFLSKISQDFQLIDEFESNPKQIMNKFGLSEKQQQIILSNDQSMISRAIINENYKKRFWSFNLPVKKSTKEGRLVVVGTGIKYFSQLTNEALYHIKNADIVYSLQADPLTVILLHKINPNIETLNNLYGEKKIRQKTYSEIITKIVNTVKANKSVCVAAYGHPGIYAMATHRAIENVRKLGLYAKMLPSVSAEDSLYADLNIDPGENGSQSYEATQFLLHKKKIDVSSLLILWQIGLVGIMDFKNTSKNWNPEGLRLLRDYLQSFYGKDYSVYIYEAAVFPVCKPRIEKVKLCELTDIEVTANMTMCIPAVEITKKKNEDIKYEFDRMFTN